ncbi:MAG: hypothetical protein IKN62_04715 [Elusimicrobia bacterium]|nr:hypothetical protein [Elusimicrobiota bacterium]
MENNEEIKQEETQVENTQEEAVSVKPKTYDVFGLLAGAVFGLFLAVVGVTDVLMGIIVGMFLGLVIGTFIKKK